MWRNWFRPFGFELDPIQHPVSIQENGEIISLESTDIAKIGIVRGSYRDLGGGDGLDVAPIVKEPLPLTPVIGTGDHSIGFVIGLAALAGLALLAVLLLKRKKKSRLFPVLFLVLSLLFLTSCGSLSKASVSDMDGAELVPLYPPAWKRPGFRHWRKHYTGTGIRNRL